MQPAGIAYTSFNTAVMDFLDDLGGTFPSCRPIKAAREFYEMGMKANKRAPLTIVHDMMMVPYGDKIRSHDEEFFMNHDYSADMAAAGSNAAWGGGQDVIGIVKGLWKDMTPDDKACVFAHLDLIVDLYDRVQASPGM